MNFKIKVSKPANEFVVNTKKVNINKEVKQPVQHFFITNSENSLTIRFNDNLFGLRKSPFQLVQLNTNPKQQENITKVLCFIKKLVRDNTPYDDIENILKQGEFATGFQSFMNKINLKRHY